MNGYNMLKCGATGIAAPDMSFYDRLRAEKTTAGLPLTTITGVPPLSFLADGRPLDNVTTIGNGQQTGTPSPDNIIMPDFCGKLVSANWTIPITCGGQTVTADLSQVQTVRRIKKLVLTGEETVSYQTGSSAPFKLTLTQQMALPETSDIFWRCSHFVSISNAEWAQHGGQYSEFLSWHASDGGSGLRFKDTAFSTVNEFKQYLSDQYSAGTPVCVWYVLATPEIAIVNEPLAKIGDYADELRSTDAGIVIPTVRGSNTLTIDTTVQPSSVTVTGHIKAIT